MTLSDMRSQLSQTVAGRLMALALVTALMGCSTQALVIRDDGSRVSGTITSSSATDVTLETDSGPISVPRAVIADIDHPGNVALTLGGIVTTYGALNLIGGLAILAETRDEPDDAGEAVVDAFGEVVGLAAILWGGLVVASGMSPLAWGASTWSESRANAAPPESPITVRFTPTGLLVTF